MLRKVINKAKEVKIKRWRSDNQEEYCFLDDYGTVSIDTEFHSDMDESRYYTGNYFKTEEEAKKYRDMLLLKQKLKDLALMLNNGEEIDWNNHNQYKWFIEYTQGFEPTSIQINCHNFTREIGQIYCLDRNFLTKAIKLIGKDKLIELIEYGI